MSPKSVSRLTDLDASGQTHAWRAAAQRFRRLEIFQIALFVAVGALAVGATLVVVRANLRAGDVQAADQRQHNNLVELRDRLRVEQRKFLERRLEGIQGVTPSTLIAVRVGEAFAESLAKEHAGRHGAAETAAIDDARRAFADLVVFVEKAGESTSPIGSPDDRATFARFTEVRSDLEDAVQRWIALNQAQVAASGQEVASRTRALMLWLPIGIGALVLVGLLIWALLDRERRKVVDALALMAGDQSVLREVATRVAQEAEPSEVLSLVARGSADVLGFDGGTITRFDGVRGKQVGVWHNPASGVDEPHEWVDLMGHSATAEVYRTGGAAVVRYADADDDEGARSLLGSGYALGIAVPVQLGETVWGALAAASNKDTVPPDAVARLGQLADLVALTLKNAEERRRLTEQAATDPLTGLSNHRTFQERLREEVARAGRHGRGLALVLMDLDHFKEVNDAFGHQTGDDVLVECARRLSEEAREGELLARIGGEEFAWLLPEVDGLDAWQAAERARQAITGIPFSGVGRLTLSAGVCDIQEARGDAGDLLRFADGALYWAKAQGRNATYRYTPEVVAELSAQDRAERLARTQALTALQALARAVDARDASTRRHSERVANLAALVAGELGWPKERVDALRQAGLMHDVGKLAVPDAILLKPGHLTPEEYDVVKLHAARGAEIVAGVLSDEQVAWVRHHHERWDGNGYPAGIAGAEIPDGALILAVSDAWDVMTSERSYSPALPGAHALEECRRQAGRQFEWRVVEGLERVVLEGHATDLVDPPVATV
jgi:diguanylate cyclase (GGDEF)-like protein/putative nucleotidyltransferase with HDIG domain